MAVISLRLNQKEENMVDFLSNYYEQDKSSLIKYSLKELYEDIIDKEIINKFESKEKKGGVKFIDSNEIVNKIKNNRLKNDNVFPLVSLCHWQRDEYESLRLRGNFLQ